MTEDEFNKLERGNTIGSITGGQGMFIEALGSEVKVKLGLSSVLPNQSEDGTIVIKKKTFMHYWHVVSCKNTLIGRTRRIYPFSP